MASPSHTGSTCCNFWKKKHIGGFHLHQELVEHVGVCLKDLTLRRSALLSWFFDKYADRDRDDLVRNHADHCTVYHYLYMCYHDHHYHYIWIIIQFHCDQDFLLRPCSSSSSAAAATSFSTFAILFGPVGDEPKPNSRDLLLEAPRVLHNQKWWLIMLHRVRSFAARCLFAKSHRTTDTDLWWLLQRIEDNWFCTPWNT